MAEGKTYTTFGGVGHGEYEEKRSVFIGSAAHTATEDEAKAFIAGIKKKYSDARHNAWAYMMSECGIARFTDDGEPQGTAGAPILNVIKGSGAVDCAVVVTRYFGGILLGTGGLVRAYTEAARLAVLDARVVTYREYTELSVTVSYAEYQRLSPELARFGALTDSTDFGAEVTVRAAVLSTSADAFCERISEITSGKGRTVRTGKRFDA